MLAKKLDWSLQAGGTKRRSRSPALTTGGTSSGHVRRGHVVQYGKSCLELGSVGHKSLPIAAIVKSSIVQLLLQSGEPGHGPESVDSGNLLAGDSGAGGSQADGRASSRGRLRKCGQCHNCQKRRRCLAPVAQLHHQARVCYHDIHCHGQLQQRYLAWECHSILCLCQVLTPCWTLPPL
jgi:hypothetical protein